MPGQQHFSPPRPQPTSPSPKPKTKSRNLSGSHGGTNSTPVSAGDKKGVVLKKNLSKGSSSGSGSMRDGSSVVLIHSKNNSGPKKNPVLSHEEKVI